MTGFKMYPYRLKGYNKPKGWVVWRIVTDDFGEVIFPNDHQMIQIMRRSLHKAVSPMVRPMVLMRWKGLSNTCIISIVGRPGLQQQQMFLESLRHQMSQNLAEAA